MLSTISGIYFAGHRKPVATAVGPAPPPVAGSGIAISVPGSATNGGTSIVDQGGILASMNAPAPVTVVTSPSPAYMVAPSGMGNYNLQSTISLTPSSQKQGSITMWLYIPSASVGANTGSYGVTYAGPAFDGIYMFGESDSSKNITLKVTTNGQNWNNVQTVPAPNYLPRDRWFMLTYVFIMNNTLPSSVWYDATLVHTWTHPSDNMSGGTYNVAMDMFGSWGGRFNSFRIGDTGYTQAEVTAKFAAERSYYGV